AVLVDDEGPTHDGNAPLHSDVEVLDLDLAARARGNAELFGKRALLVGQQSERQLVVLLEQLMRFSTVAADADNFDTLVGKFLRIVAESAGLCRAAAGKIGGIEINDQDLFPDVVFGLPSISLVIGSLKRWG